MAESVRLLLADDNERMRGALRALLRTSPDINVLAEATDGLSAVQTATELSPDVVIMDLQMPGISGLDATRQILKSVPGVRVIVLSAHEDPYYVRGVIQSGAMGFVVKDSAFEELVPAIRSAMRGELFLSGRVAGLLNPPTS